MTTSPELPRRPVVTAFLRHQGRILLVRRSARVGSYQGRWAAISGYLEVEDPLLQARREIWEETSLAAEQTRLIARGAPLEVPAPELGWCWLVHPFLFEVESPEAIQLDWEHSEMRWVSPDELRDFPCVPALEQALQRVSTP